MGGGSGGEGGGAVSASVPKDPRPIIDRVSDEGSVSAGTWMGADGVRVLTVMNREGDSVSGRPQRGGRGRARRAHARRLCTATNPRTDRHIWMHGSAGSAVTAPISHLIFNELVSPRRREEGDKAGRGVFDEESNIHQSNRGLRFPIKIIRNMERDQSQ